MVAPRQRRQCLIHVATSAHTHARCICCVSVGYGGGCGGRDRNRLRFHPKVSARKYVWHVVVKFNVHSLSGIELACDRMHQAIGNCITFRSCWLKQTLMQFT